MADRALLAAVLFDAGGTLVRLDFEWMSELLRTFDLDIDPFRLRRGEIEGRRRYDASRGGTPTPGAPPPALGSSGDTRAYFAGMLEAAGVPAAHVASVLERFVARHDERGLWTRPVEGARATIDRLAGMGLRVAVISNADGRAEQHLIDCGLRTGLELVVDSFWVGIEKPDPRIFGIALGALEVAPPRALYVGDIASVDVLGARAAGMPVVLIDPYRNYAAAGVAAIPHVAALPEWITEHFETARGSSRARRGRPGSPPAEPSLEGVPS